jgi:hypothetical protein
MSVPGGSDTRLTTVVDCIRTAQVEFNRLYLFVQYPRDCRDN